MTNNPACISRLENISNPASDCKLETEWAWAGFMTLYSVCHISILVQIEVYRWLVECVEGEAGSCCFIALTPNCKTQLHWSDALDGTGLEHNEWN